MHMRSTTGTAKIRRKIRGKLTNLPTVGSNSNNGENFELVMSSKSVKTILSPVTASLSKLQIPKTKASSKPKV